MMAVGGPHSDDDDPSHQAVEAAGILADVHAQSGGAPRLSPRRRCSDPGQAVWDVTTARPIRVGACAVLKRRFALPNEKFRSVSIAKSMTTARTKLARGGCELVGLDSTRLETMSPDLLVGLLGSLRNLRRERFFKQHQQQAPAYDDETG